MMIPIINPHGFAFGGSGVGVGVGVAVGTAVGIIVGVAVGVTAGGTVGVGVGIGVGLGDGLGVGVGKGTTAILVVSLIKPFDFADITAIPETSDVNCVSDKSFFAGIIREEGTDPRFVEILTEISTSVTTGLSFSSNSLTVIIAVSPTSIVDGSAVNSSLMGMP